MNDLHSILILTSSLQIEAGGLYYSVPALSKACHDALEHANIQILAPHKIVLKETLVHWSPLELNLSLPLGPNTYKYAPGLLSSLSELQPDILHVHGIWMYPSFATYRYARKHNKPYLISPRGMLDPWALAHSAWKKKLMGFLVENRVIQNADCIHALNTEELQSVRAYGYQGPVAVIPNGVELPDESLLAAEAEKKRRASTDGLHFVFLSRLHPKKQVLELIQCMDVFSQKYPDRKWVLDIAGTGTADYEKELKQAAAPFGERIRFHGHVTGTEKSQLLAQADWFILPSHSEGLPMAVLEAWAHGVPTLITRACNLSSSFEEDFSICLEADQVLWPDAIDALFETSPEERILLGAQARVYAKDHYSWAEQGRKMARVYEWLVDGAEKPDCVITKGVE
ncbi:glycosyltransferase [Kiritimatiellota bacterium B12222]|nr:glycosyltransferase [Kiritimatiellota bacterium B12222]